MYFMYKDNTKNTTLQQYRTTDLNNVNLFYNEMVELGWS